MPRLCTPARGEELVYGQQAGGGGGEVGEKRGYSPGGNGQDLSEVKSLPSGTHSEERRCEGH